MKNFEKYGEDIKKVDYNFAVNKKTRKIFQCGHGYVLCGDCIFSDSCETKRKIEWLYEEYKPKTILTIKEAEELLKDKYPQGVEIINE